MDESRPMERFAKFVSEILTVTKEDIRKADDAATDPVKPTEPKSEEEC